MALRCKDDPTGRPRRPEKPALSPFARPDGTCLGRRPEEQPDEPVPEAPADPEAPPVDPTAPTNPA